MGIRDVLRIAARTGRRHIWPILLVATVVALMIAVAEVISDNAVDPTNDALSIGGSLTVEAISLFGTILLAGFLCKLVGHDLAGSDDAAAAAGHDGQRITIVVVLRTLPWFSLIVADILYSIATLAGLLLLVIPGLILATLFAIVAPSIEIEGRSAVSSLRRSAHLVRRHFWTVALLVSVPQLSLALVESILPTPHGALHIVEVVVIRGIVLAPFEAAVGLVLVALSYRLMALDPPRPSAIAPAAASG